MYTISKAQKYNAIVEATVLDLSEEIMDKMIKPSQVPTQFLISSINEHILWK